MSKEAGAKKISIVSTSPIVNYPNIYGIDISPIDSFHSYSLVYDGTQIINYQDAKSPSNIDLDLGILIDLSKSIFLGFSMNYLLEPQFQFISETDKLERNMTTGICYNWRNSVNFLADHSWSKNDSKWNKRIYRSWAR